MELKLKDYSRIGVKLCDDLTQNMSNITDDLMITKYPRAATIVASICAIVFCAIGVIGNSITVIALCRCSKLRSHATTSFVLSLCVSDLLFCLVNLPLTAIRYVNEEWTLGDTLCQIFPVFFYGNVAVSLLSMVAITLSRYVLISYNKYYDQIYCTISIWMQLVAVWLIAIFIMLPPLLGIWGKLGLNPSTFSCTILKKDDKSPKKMLFLIGFVLPCIVIIISYSCIYWKVKRSRFNMEIHHRPTAKEDRLDQRRTRDDRRLTRLMLTIFICFLCCFLPLMLMNVFDDEVTYPSIHVIASILAWASSVINPFIYAASNRQYRSAYSNLFRLIRTSVAVTDSRQISSIRSKPMNNHGEIDKFKPNLGAT